MSAHTKKPPKAKADPGATINLQNPVSDQFEPFVIDNSARWQVHALVALEAVLPPDDYATLFDRFMSFKRGLAWTEDRMFRAAAMTHVAPSTMVQAGSGNGQSVVICGAGPSLNDHAADYCASADQVWGCNSALTHLLKQGRRVTHGFTIDQTPHMCLEWQQLPEVEYVVATTIHPHLTAMLYGAARTVKWFHNYVGMAGQPVPWPDENGVYAYYTRESWVYNTMWPPTMMAGSGLNAVTRAIDVALCMGFETITVLGADCCMQVKGAHRTDLPFMSKRHLEWLRTHTVMHADGGHALASGATAVTLTAEIDPGTADETIRPGHGRWFTTKPDMAISAQWLMKMAKAYPHIRLIGDTLPNALMGKTDEYLKRLPNFMDTEGSVVGVPEIAPAGAA